jgi:hypothetical protein
MSSRHVMCPHSSELPFPAPMADAYGRAPYGGDRDEDDAAMSREWQAQKDATVFLVDCGRSMERSVSLRGSEDASVSHRGVDLALHLIETTLRNTCVHGWQARPPS